AVRLPEAVAGSAISAGEGSLGRVVRERRLVRLAQPPLFDGAALNRGRYARVCATPGIREGQVRGVLHLQTPHEQRRLTRRAGEHITINAPAVPSRVERGMSEIGQVAELRVPIVTNDPANHRQVGLSPWMAEENIQAFAGFPLVIGDQLLGVLAVYHRRPLDRNTIELLTLFAQHAATAIQEAHLFHLATEQTARLGAVNAELQRANQHKSEFLANM